MCFAVLVGTPEHGRWLLQPASPARAVRRRYRPGTPVIETELETDEGAVAIVDSMLCGNDPDVVRVVEGRRGRVLMRIKLVIRAQPHCPRRAGRATPRR